MSLPLSFRASEKRRLPTSMRLACKLALTSLILVAMTGCWGSRSRSTAAQPSSDAQVQSNDDAIKSIGRRPWYDASAQDYRAPRPSADLDHPLRRNGTQASETVALAPAAGGRGLSLPSGELIGYGILIALGVALLIVTIVIITNTFHEWRPDQRLQQNTKGIAIDPARVADLPFEARAEMEDPLAYARQLIAEGNFDLAIHFLYGYMLLALDQSGKIMLHRGKTNRMYLNELGSERQLRNYLVPAMLAFEDSFFGRHAIERDRFLSIWGQLDNFHRALEPVPTAVLQEETPAS